MQNRERALILVEKRRLRTSNRDLVDLSLLTTTIPPPTSPLALQEQQQQGWQQQEQELKRGHSTSKRRHGVGRVSGFFSPSTARTRIVAAADADADDADESYQQPSCPNPHETNRSPKEQG